MDANAQFEAIVNEYYEALFRFAMSLTRAESDAQDLTQQTFYVWATKGHQLRDISKVKAWLFTTLHRAYLETRRRITKFPHHELEEVAHQLPILSPEVASQLDSSEVLIALSEVDEVYQAAVALFYLEDCSYKEIAGILEVPLGTVKSRIARGLAQLKEILMSKDAGSLPCPKGGAAAMPVREGPVQSQERHCPSRPENETVWDLGAALFGEPHRAF